MLQYIDNYRYSTADRQQIDLELQQLYTGIKNDMDCYQLYQQIRRYIYKEIKIEQLAISIVLNDLLEIRERSESAFILILYYVANPLSSYQQIADEYSISKQRVHQVISEYSSRYKWLDNLKRIKGQQDGKTQLKQAKNAKKRVSMKSYQLDMFDQRGTKAAGVGSFSG